MCLNENKMRRVVLIIDLLKILVGKKEIIGKVIILLNELFSYVEIDKIV